MEDSMFKTALEHQSHDQKYIVTVNGIETEFTPGETVASVLLRAPNTGRTTPISGALRLPYCQMGVCFECLAIVDDVPSSQGCLIPLQNGMRIERQIGARELNDDL